VDSAGSAIAPLADNANWGVDGSGNLLSTGAGVGRVNQFLDTSSVSGGLVFYRIDIASWSGTSGNFFFGMRLRDTGSTVNQFHDVNMSGSVNTDSPGAWTWLAPGLGANSASGVSWILSAELDTDTFTLWRDTGLTGTYTQIHTNSLGMSGITDWGQVNALTIDTPGGTVAIDRIVLGDDFNEIAAIPEPGTLGLVGLVGGALLAIRRRCMKK
jgi:hypothetical protein